MSGNRFQLKYVNMIDEPFQKRVIYDTATETEYNCTMAHQEDLCDLLNKFQALSVEDLKTMEELQREIRELHHKLDDCARLKGKRLNKIRNHRAVIEDLGGSIRAYKGKLSQANEKLNRIKVEVEETGALTKSQVEMILNE